ncbi:phage head morphogenesis protein [Janthinobacterium aquaticum]|uniref:phage head morphogenesis protein n=1 Tax=Janthinobacterium sp. FT58W TaxID=2654254 RepID=UPI0012648F11|nr:phage minor head protein [Janthinobacterium sp. FT58W]KAB8037401.1 head morphogenesis protein [Janthinobacterium sp. FT58W]
MPVPANFPGKDAAGNYVANPFAEQLNFFEQKLNLPTARWDDIMRSAHDRAFIVAGAANADLLNDLHAAVRKAIEGGAGIDAFKKDFDALVKKNGWTGWTGEGSKAGRAWRADVIYKTNMSTSYAAGRWRQLTDPGLLSLRPYWKYVHSDSVLHPRPLHLSWDGIVLRHDHPFWLTHFCPNGWGCECRIISVDAAEHARAKKAGLDEPPEGWDEIDPKTMAPVGIDRGFDYAPGANVAKPLAELVDAKLIKLDAAVGAVMNQALRPALQRERDAAYRTFVSEAKAAPAPAGRVAVIGALSPETIAWMTKNQVPVPNAAAVSMRDSVIASSQTARSQAAGALSADDVARLPGLLAQPDQLLFDTRTGRLVYVSYAGEPRQAVIAAEAQLTERGMYEVVSAYKPAGDLQSDIAQGRYAIIH